MNEQELRLKRLDAIYRFWRRYLMKFHPEISHKINVEGKTAEQIEKLEAELVDWQGKNEEYYNNLGGQIG